MSIMPEISYPFTQKLQYTQEFTITYNTLLQQSIFLSTKDWIELRDKTKTIVTVCFIPREIYSPLCSFCHFSYTFSLAIPASVSANYFFAKQWHHFPSCKLSKYWMSSRCVQYFCLSCLSIPTELHTPVYYWDKQRMYLTSQKWPKPEELQLALFSKTYFTSVGVF